MANGWSHAHGKTGSEVVPSCWQATLTRKYIRENFEYRYVAVDNGRDALALERDVQRGAMSVGKPFLNPL